uniref:Peptidase S1 domain-containing protein n=1 Tax=Panagrellus redivivus TaxID=6233 RepID=A0A7E4V6H8_PANRE
MRAVGIALFVFCIFPLTSGLKTKYYVNGQNQEYECVDDSSDTSNLCELIEACADHDEVAHCKEQVLLAVFKDNKFYAKAFGVVIGNKYVLTTVSSRIPKFFTREEWVAINSPHGYMLTSSQLRPAVKFGRYNLTAWHDLAVFELAWKNGNFGFATSIRELQPGEIPWGVDTGSSGKGVKYDKLKMGTDAECTQAFATEEPHFNKEIMYCAKDEHYNVANNKNTVRTLGSGVVAGSDRKIVGLKSLYSTRSNYFIIVKVAKFCGWLKEISNNDIDC